MDLVLLLAILIHIFCLLLGLLLFFRPNRAIEIQRRFYLVINWRMEPVDMAKEIRMTRYMGIFMIVMVSAAMVCVYYLI